MSNVEKALKTAAASMPAAEPGDMVDSNRTLLARSVVEQFVRALPPFYNITNVLSELDRLPAGWCPKLPIEQLREVTQQACTPGNAHDNQYMFGMANGLILALAIMQNEQPKYLEKPEKFLDAT